MTNGDAVVAEIAAAAGVDAADVLPWRDVLHDGPVPGGLDPPELAGVRAAHLASRGWAEEGRALADLRKRDARLEAVPDAEEIVLWFEEDLYDALQLAQVAERVQGHAGPVSLVALPHPPRGDLTAALAARRPYVPDAAAFAALRSPDPRRWLEVPAFARLLEELPDSTTGLSRTERQILQALTAGPLAPRELFSAVSAYEQPPWLGDWPLWAIADELAPLVSHEDDGPYAITDAGREVLEGGARRPVPERWIGGVQLGRGRPAWAWDSERGSVAAGS